MTAPVIAPLQDGNCLLMTKAPTHFFSDGAHWYAGIKKCHVQEGSPCKVQTEGVNFPGAWTHADLVDATAIESNDIAAVFDVLGVEAARATLVRECGAVFGAYGIAVDPRHLSLIADSMTHQVLLLEAALWGVHRRAANGIFPMSLAEGWSCLLCRCKKLQYWQACVLAACK